MSSNAQSLLEELAENPSYALYCAVVGELDYDNEFEGEARAEANEILNRLYDYE